MRKNPAVHRKWCVSGLCGINRRKSAHWVWSVRLTNMGVATIWHTSVYRPQCLIDKCCEGHCKHTSQALNETNLQVCRTWPLLLEKWMKKCELKHYTHNAHSLCQCSTISTSYWAFSQCDLETVSCPTDQLDNWQLTSATPLITQILSSATLILKWWSGSFLKWATCLPLFDQHVAQLNKLDTDIKAKHFIVFTILDLCKWTWSVNCPFSDRTKSICIYYSHMFKYK